MKTVYIIKLKGVDLYVGNFMLTDDVVLVSTLENARQSTDKDEAISYRDSLPLKDSLEVYEASVVINVGDKMG